MAIFAFFGFLIWSLVVAYRDLATFRISNSALAYFIFFGYPLLITTGFSFNLSIARSLLVIAIFCSGAFSLMGMGDAKLIATLTPFLNMTEPISLIIPIAIMAIGQLLYISWRSRVWQKRIAFAPAILLATAINMAPQLSFF
jgi:Flp pilus assembly protein protease CpaA